MPKVTAASAAETSLEVSGQAEVIKKNRELLAFDRGLSVRELVRHSDLILET